MEKNKAIRRRGSALEEAILDAAWAELEENGYLNFTMEAVAERAGTSRTVLHRRWTSRGELAGSAVKRRIEESPVEVPDLGSVRKELALALKKISKKGAPVFTVLMNMSGYFLETKSNLSDLRRKLTGKSLVEEILQRGVLRGELDSTKITPRIAALPLDLIRHESMMTLRAPSEEVISEILDQIFLPLVLVKK